MLLKASALKLTFRLDAVASIDSTLQLLNEYFAKVYDEP